MTTLDGTVEMWEKLKNFWKTDDLLEEAWEQSFEMLEICREMFLEAMDVLRNKNSDQINGQVKEKDKIVNQYEREVRKKVLTHLSLRAPHGLPEGLVLVSIVIDMERLGDYTKNIIDIASYHKKPLVGGKFEKDLKKVEAAIIDNFSNTIACVTSSNQSNAIELLDKYKWVNPLCDTTLKALIKEEDKSLSSGQATSLALYFRWLKRINAHLRNILTSVINPFDRVGFKPTK
jgi:Na+/phosphate symporter